MLFKKIFVRFFAFVNWNIYFRGILSKFYLYIFPDISSTFSLAKGAAYSVDTVVGFEFLKTNLLYGQRSLGN